MLIILHWHNNIRKR